MYKCKGLKYYWSEIQTGEKPFFDVVLAFLEILEQRPNHHNDDTFYVSFTKKELYKRVKEKLKKYELGITRQRVCFILCTFLENQEIRHENTRNNYRRMALNNQKIRELRQWTDYISSMAGYRELFGWEQDITNPLN